MIVVSNTSPLNYLLLIGEEHLLTRLFGSLHVPEAVQWELRAIESNSRVRNWAATPPDWIKIYSAPLTKLLSKIELHRGETEAILLAQQLSADALLMDELDGRTVAREFGLTVLGTVGLLDLAADKGLVDFRDALTRLRATSFRISPRLITQFLTRDHERRARKNMPPRAPDR